VNRLQQPGPRQRKRSGIHYSTLGEFDQIGIHGVSNSESPQFIGRVIAELYRDPHLAELSGRVSVAVELARDYGITDIDGSSPEPLGLQTC